LDGEGLDDVTDGLVRWLAFFEQPLADLTELVNLALLYCTPLTLIGKAGFVARLRMDFLVF